MTADPERVRALTASLGPGRKLCPECADTVLELLDAVRDPREQVRLPSQDMSAEQHGAPQSYALNAAVADAQRQGWQFEAGGPGWAQFGKWQPVNHAALLLFSIFTLGLGLLVWIAVAARGPQWRRMVITTDAAGQITVVHLDAKGRPV